MRLDLVQEWRRRGRGCPPWAASGTLPAPPSPASAPKKPRRVIAIGSPSRSLLPDFHSREQGRREVHESRYFTTPQLAVRDVTVRVDGADIGADARHVGRYLAVLGHLEPDRRCDDTVSAVRIGDV